MILTNLKTDKKMLLMEGRLGNSALAKWLIQNQRNVEYIAEYDSYGANYNGYGYADTIRTYTLTRRGVIKVNQLLKGAKDARKKKKSPEEIKLAWCRRLVKMTGISMDDAIDIADDKVEYHNDRIDEMQDRQCDRYSTKREILLRKMKRENPLRRIVDLQHACAVLAASHRHRNTNYEGLLDYAHNLEKIGDIARGSAQEYARINMHTNI